MGQRILSPNRQTETVSEPLKKGNLVQLPSAKLADDRPTLILVLSTTCGHCDECREFYRRLLGVSTARTAAVFPQPPQQAKAYLDAAGIKVDEVIQANPAHLGAPGTPALILADRHGRIEASWIG